MNGLRKHSGIIGVTRGFLSVTIIIFLDPVRYVAIKVQPVKSLVILKKIEFKKFIM